MLCVKTINFYASILILHQLRFLHRLLLFY